MIDIKNILKIIFNFIIIIVISIVLANIFVFLLPIILILVLVYYIYKVYQSKKGKVKNLNKVKKSDQKIVDAEIIEEKFDK